MNFLKRIYMMYVHPEVCWKHKKFKDVSWPGFHCETCNYERREKREQKHQQFMKRYGVRY